MAPVNAGTLKVVAVKNSIQQIPASAAVEMELSVRNFSLDVSESFDRNVKPLMPLKTTREQNNEFTVGSGSFMAGKHFGVDVIDKNRALILGDRACNYSFMPKVV